MIGKSKSTFLLQVKILFQVKLRDGLDRLQGGGRIDQLSLNPLRIIVTIVVFGNDDNSFVYYCGKRRRSNPRGI